MRTSSAPYRRATRAIGQALAVAILAGCARDESARAVPPWLEIAETSDGRLSLDTSRIEVGAASVSVWLRVDFAEEKKFANGGGYRTTLIRQELRCRALEGRSREMNAFLPGEDSTQFFVFPDTAWKDFRAQQLDEVYSRGACMLLDRLGRQPPA